MAISTTFPSLPTCLFGKSNISPTKYLSGLDFIWVYLPNPNLALCLDTSLNHLPGSRSHAGWWRWLWLACHSGTHDISGSLCFYLVPHMQSPWEEKNKTKHRVNEDTQEEVTDKGVKTKRGGGFVELFLVLPGDREDKWCKCVCASSFWTDSTWRQMRDELTFISLMTTEHTHIRTYTHSGRWTPEINRAVWCKRELNKVTVGKNLPLGPLEPKTI